MKHECVAFDGVRKIAAGELNEVVAKLRKLGPSRARSVLLFDDATGEPIDIDWRSGHDAITTKPVSEESKGPGRPKLGVVAREVTLLPRHWEWLNLQPGGASVALRKLVDEARRINRHTDRIRRASEAAYRFTSAMAGNEPGFEEATRGLFAGDLTRFAQFSRNWPPDVRDHAAKLAARAFEQEKEPSA